MVASLTTTWSCAFLTQLAVLVFSGAYGQLSETFYAQTCPSLATIVHNAMVTAMNPAVGGELRMGASLLRLHFHDCFVQGCDASVLLDDVPGLVGEKGAFGNMNSVRGFEVINTIKANVEAACPNTVSCADILALAARDGTVLLNGPSWAVPLGRRDSMNASRDLANADLPPPFANLVNPDGSGLIARFQRKGLSASEMTALSGAHTIGFAQCQNYRDRLYNEPNIDPVFARDLKANCPATGPAGNTFLSPFDPTGNTFDNKYYEALAARRGLLHSDHVLYNPSGPQPQVNQVNLYKSNITRFFEDFKIAMVKMGNLNPPPGTPTQIRLDCRFVNP